MRGDGGAADLRDDAPAIRSSPPSAGPPHRSPARCATPLLDGVVIEVGGTSTNVSVVKAGRPILAYVRVLDHLTCVRSLDVRVAGIAGGSLAARRARWGGRASPTSARARRTSPGCRTPASPSRRALEGAVRGSSRPRRAIPTQYAVLETPAASASPSP